MNVERAIYFAIIAFLTILTWFQFSIIMSDERFILIDSADARNKDRKVVIVVDDVQKVFGIKEFLQRLEFCSFDEKKFFDCEKFQWR